MKNILTAAFLIGFLGICTGLFGHNLRLLDKNLPCVNQNFGKYQTYELYLEARAPDFVNNVNQQVISIVPIVNGPNVTLQFSGAKIQYTGSPTGWAYRVNYRMGGLAYVPPAIPRSFIVEEYDPSTGIRYNKTIEMKRKDVLAPVVDIEVLESDLCAGTITVNAITNSAIDGFEYSHKFYDWYHNGNLITSTVNHHITKSTVTLNVGASSSSFDIKVVVKDLYANAVPPTVCAQTSYTKSFTIPTPAAVLPAFYTRKNIDLNYCDRRNNEFYIDNPTSGVEYKWEFIATPSGYSETKIGLDLTSFSPNFGSLPNITGPGDVSSYNLTVSYRVACGAWTQLTPLTTISTAPFNVSPWINPPFNAVTIVQGVPYRNCYVTPNRIIADQNKLDAVEELSTNTTNNNNNTITASKFSTLGNMDNAITAFPNPTTGLLELKSESEKIEAVNVYNVTGVLVTQQLNVNTTNPTLDLSKLAKGMYMVNIQTATTNKTIQVIKE